MKKSSTERQIQWISNYEQWEISSHSAILCQSQPENIMTSKEFSLNYSSIDTHNNLLRKHRYPKWINLYEKLKPSEYELAILKINAYLFFPKIQQVLSNKRMTVRISENLLHASNTLEYLASLSVCLSPIRIHFFYNFSPCFTRDSTLNAVSGRINHWQEVPIIGDYH